MLSERKRRQLMRGLRLAAGIGKALVALSLLVTATGTANGQKKVKWTSQDPYTRGDAKLIEAAGYESVGAMRWGPDHDSDAIHQLVGKLPICWIETAHFRIACILPPCRADGDKATRKKIKGELKRLKKKLPAVKSNALNLDRWLRAHLFAQRCEDTYAAFSERLGVDDDSFPAYPNEINSEKYMGLGPYLGQADKYLVMLCEKESTLGRYANRYMDKSQSYARRWNFGRRDSLFFGTAIEFYEGRLANDQRLHCHLVYNLTINFCDGFKQYCQDIPVWWKFGIAAWFSSKIDKRYRDYDRPPDGVEPDVRAAWRWEPKVLKLVKNDGAIQLTELLERMDFAKYRFHDFLVAWSVVDFLMTKGNDKFSTYMHAIKRPIKTGRDGSVPTTPEMLKHQAKALDAAWKLDAESLEKAWQAYVLKNY